MGLLLFTREMDMDGNETMESADKLFTVYPDQVVLPPKSFQSVRIRWKGPVDLTREQSYRILVEQVPVDFESQSRKRSGLKIQGFDNETGESVSIEAEDLREKKGFACCTGEGGE